MPDLESRPAAVHTVSVKARLAAAGLRHGAARPGWRPAPDGGEQASVRVAEAQSRAREHGDRQRQAVSALHGPGARSGLLAGAGGGHGLTAMRERAQRAGGTARADRGGWLVELEVPE